MCQLGIVGEAQASHCQGVSGKTRETVSGLAAQKESGQDLCGTVQKAWWPELHI